MKGFSYFLLFITLILWGCGKKKVDEKRTTLERKINFDRVISQTEEIEEIDNFIEELAEAERAIRE